MSNSLRHTVSFHSGALDGLQESSSAVLDFRLLGEGLEGKEFFSQNEPLKAKLSDAPKIATSFHLLMSAHIGGGLWGEREVPRESPPLCSTHKGRKKLR